ncbi:unnamed protein product, partial [Discosporangium mesarthrocarpum]
MALPLSDDILKELGGSTTYSIFDLQSDFWQCAIEDDSISITAVATLEGLLEWTRMRQGTCGSTGCFSCIAQLVI